MLRCSPNLHSSRSQNRARLSCRAVCRSLQALSSRISNSRACKRAQEERSAQEAVKMAHGCTVGGATNDKSQIQLDFDMQGWVNPEDRQVKCLVASRGLLWMEDCCGRLPRADRRPDLGCRARSTALKGRAF